MHITLVYKLVPEWVEVNCRYLFTPVWQSLVITCLTWFYFCTTFISFQKLIKSCHYTILMFCFLYYQTSAVSTLWANLKDLNNVDSTFWVSSFTAGVVAVLLFFLCYNHFATPSYVHMYHCLLKINSIINIFF